MCATSIPSNVAAADAKVLNPSSGRVRLLMKRWSCSTMMFKYFNWDWATRAFQHLVYGLDVSRVSSAFVDDNLSRKAVDLQCPGKEFGGGGFVSTLRKHEIKRLTVFIDRSVEIDPRAFHLDVSSLIEQQLSVRSVRYRPPARFFPKSSCWSFISAFKASTPRGFVRGLDCEPHVDRTGSVDSLPCWSIRQLVIG